MQSPASRTVFTTYRGSKPLEQTSAQDIPASEQAAYWALLSAPVAWAPPAEDLQALHEVWLSEQRRRRRPKVLIQMSGGMPLRAFVSEGLEVEVVFLDHDRLEQTDGLRDLQLQEFVWNAIEQMPSARQITENKLRFLGPKDPIA